MDSALSIILPEGTSLNLTDTEQMFLYQLEVIGLPVARAAEISGLSSPYVQLKKPHMLAAREQLRVAMRGRTDFSREDVVAGIKEAIDQAAVLDDPMARIAGWREIAKLLGYDKTPSITININGNAQQVQRQIQGMTTEQLMEMTGENVLDADFYEVKK